MFIAFGESRQAAAMARLTCILLAVLCMMQPCHTNEPCDLVRIEGTTNRHEVLGVYRKTGVICSGYNVYDQVGGISVLRYIEDDIDEGWMVVYDPDSQEVCERGGVISVVANGGNPEETDNKWKELSEEDVWELNPQITVTCHEGFQGCESVEVAGTPSSDGVYKVDMKEANFCAGRYSYMQASSQGTHYLYYVYNTWAISNRRCDDLQKVRVMDGAIYPENIQKYWQNYVPDNSTHGEWKSAPSRIDVFCEEPETFWTQKNIIYVAAGGGGGLLFFIIIIIVVCCCCCREKCCKCCSNDGEQSGPYTQSPYNPPGQVMPIGNINQTITTTSETPRSKKDSNNTPGSGTKTTNVQVNIM